MPSSWRGLHVGRVSYHLPVALPACPMVERRGKTLFNSSKRLSFTRNGGMGQAMHVAHMAVYVSNANALHEDVEDRT
jgi:hypothetical protein